MLLDLVLDERTLRPLHQRAGVEEARDVPMSSEEWLMLNVIRQAKEDYRVGGPITKKGVEQFLDSGLFHLFCDARDLDAEVMRESFIRRADIKVRYKAGTGVSWKY